jgi:hypothetical protein
VRGERRRTVEVQVLIRGTVEKLPLVVYPVDLARGSS